MSFRDILLNRAEYRRHSNGIIHPHDYLSDDDRNYLEGCLKKAKEILKDSIGDKKCPIMQEMCCLACPSCAAYMAPRILTAHLFMLSGFDTYATTGSCRKDVWKIPVPIDTW